MNFASRHLRLLNPALSTVTTALLLSACGGGGGGAAPTAGGGSDTVAIAGLPTNDVAMYGKKLTLTVNGSNVDKLAVTASGCKDVALSTSGKFVSSASTAYFQCTVSAVGTAQLVLNHPADGKTLVTVSVPVPLPQVTMNFSNGAGINGNVTVTLAPDKTPITVDNFLQYVNSGFYTDTRIHRVVPGFIIQGGGYAGVISGDAQNAVIPGTKPTAAKIVLEVNKGLLNKQWTIAMARDDAPDTASSQFYFNLTDNAGLDPQAATTTTAARAGYAVFGSVTAGTSNVAAIANPTIAPCVSISPPLRPFTIAPECTPIPNVVLTSATQTQ
jgi:cyclophilin family peptidyl-prolyl cis-trans isomerase